jgi:hypothetical protein
VSAVRRLIDGEPGHELKLALAPLFERADEAVIVASFIKRTTLRLSSLTMPPSARRSSCVVRPHPA